MARFTVDDYRLDAAMLLSCSRRQLRRMANRANDTLDIQYACYQGLTREETVVAARARRDDAFYMLEHKGY